jgi:hypothetical protein
MQSMPINLKISVPWKNSAYTVLNGHIITRKVVTAEIN